MKIIPTFVHGITDYLMGVLLLVAPNLLGFADLGGAAVWVPRILGVIILLQSIMTDYELGLVKKLPMRMHLMNDYAGGLVLAASPWIFGFADQPSNAWMPHLILGVFIFITSLLTDPQPHGTAHTTRR
jgi:uncharacterized membrane protein YtjA (UPF0391 family)